ncbi:Ig-like domain-containing protein, partial [Azonexus caeni]|uniref:Ig-like domain-containing protein n=1 Tax=Azonexus caeni TaxID=266126 RepID=UPI003A885935
NWNGSVPQVTYTTNTGSTSTLDITVTPLDDTPAASDDTARTDEDRAVTIDVLANDRDVDGDPLTITQVNGTAIAVGSPVAVANGEVRLTADGKLEFAPAANYHGPADFTYTVTDGRTPVQANVHVDVTPVNDAPVANDDRVTVVEDEPKTINVLGNDSDIDGDKLTITQINGTAITVGVPLAVSNGTVTVNGDGTVTFDPAPGYNGEAIFTYTVSDGQATDTATVTIDVGGVNDAPVAAPDVGTTDEDTVLNVPAASGVILGAGADTDVDGDSLQVSGVAFGGALGKVGEGVAGQWGTLTLNADGSYRYQPNDAAQGLDDGESRQDVFSYTVSDAAGLTSTTTLTITVTGVNDGPVAVDDSKQIPEDTPVILPVLANDSDVDGDALTITQINGQSVTVGQAVTLSSATGSTIGTVTVNGDGTVTFDPEPNFNGPVDFTYTVTDGTASDVANVHLVVDDVNDPPVARDNLVEGDEDTPVTFDPRSNDSDDDGDPLTITEVNGTAIDANNPVVLTQGVIEMNADGTLSFTPNANYNGTFTFEYTVDDGRGGSDTATVEMKINAVNDPSVLAADTKTVFEDSVASGNVLANDSDLDDTLTVASFTVNGATVNAGETVTLANIGKLTIGSDGEYTFTPVANWNGSVPQVTYTTNTGSTSTLDITVTPLDDTPAASDDTARTEEDRSVVIDVLANDRDVDGDPLTITQVNGTAIAVGSPVAVANGEVRLTADGKLEFAPSANYHGPVDFTYTVTDGRTPVQANVHVDVTPVNDAPVANDDRVTMLEDEPKTINVLGNDSDIDGDKLTITEINGTAITVGVPLAVTNGTVTVNGDGTVTFDPDPGYNGGASFTYTVSDGTATDTATVTIDVGGVNDAPVAAPDAGTTDEDTVLNVAAADGVILGAGADTDVDGDSLQVSGVAFGGALGKVGEGVAGQWGTLTLNADGSYRYQPNEAAQGLDDGESRQDVFTYTVSDPAGLTSTTTLTITVTGVNDGPVAVDDSKQIPEDTPVILPVLANDSDVDGDTLTITHINGQPVTVGQVVTLSTTTGGAIGTVTLNADGTVTFDPEANFNGPVDFTYTVTDGTASDVANVHLVVDDVNDPPVARDNLVEGDEDTPVTFDPRSNDSDDDGDPLTITEINGTAIDVNNPVVVTQGVIEMNADGTLSFTPNANYNGAFTFEYTVDDGRGGSDTATVEVKINPIGDPPVITGDDLGAVTEDASNPNLTDTGTLLVTDVDGLDEAQFQTNGIVASAGALGGLTITTTGDWTYTVANADVQYLGEGETKIETFTVKTVDGTTHDVVITITGTNDGAEVSGKDKGAVTEDASNPNLTDTGTLLVTDVDGTDEAQFQTTGIVASAGALGGLTITTTGDWTYTVANADVQYLGEGETKIETFTVKTVDGTTHDVV